MGEIYSQESSSHSKYLITFVILYAKDWNWREKHHFFSWRLCEIQSVYAIDQIIGLKFSVYFFDLPGHGTSQTDGYPKSAIDEIVTQIRKMNFKDPILVGHSFGGFCAYEVSRHLKDVSKIILFDPLITEIKISKIKFIWVFLLNMKRSVSNSKISKFYFRGFGDLLFNLFSQNIYSLNSLKLIIRSAYKKKSKLEEKLSKKLVIYHGKYDSVISIEEIEKDFPSNTTIIDGEHDWCMEDIDYTKKLIVQVLEQH